MNLTPIRENAALSVTAAKSGPGRFLIRLINAGEGSSGVYTPDVLKAAAEAKIFAKGCHMYIDHPGAEESVDRPERTLKDLAAVLAEDAYWDESAQALVAEADVFSRWRTVLTEMKDAIGTSIRAIAEAVQGEHDGKPAVLISQIVEAISVDFVTKAGRGGAILEVLESARATPRAIARGVAEATANDRRAQLQALLKAANGGERTYVWVEDFDETTVWFEIESPHGSGIYQQTYATTGDAATSLVDTPIQVRVRRTYVPVGESATPTASTTNVAENNDPAQPSGRTTHTAEEKEIPMAEIKVEETRLRQLEEDAGRVNALESERDTATQRAEAAEAALATERRTARANAIINAAEADFDEWQRAGLVANLPLTEAGELDEAALTTRVDEAAAKIAEANGAGSVRGLGDTHVKEGMTLDEFDKGLEALKEAY